MRWDDVKYFLAVARSGSLSAAARRLNVNHSTVFRRVEALESRLGARLFDRMPNGYVPTEAGRQVMDYALRAEESVHDFERSVFGMDLEPEGTVRLTAPNGLAAHPVAGYLQTFRQKHPNILLSLIINNRVLSLKRGEADIALRPGPYASEELVGRKIATITWAAYASPDYIARRGRPQTPADLDAHDIIAFGEKQSQLPAARWLKRHAPQARVAIRVDDIATMRHVCAAGMGIAVLPMWGYAASPIPVLPPEPSLASPLYLYTHPDLRRVARIRSVMDHLAECFAADAAHHTRFP